MKVLLVNPPDKYQARFPGIIQVQVAEHAYAPPMGLMSIKSHISSVMQAEIRLFNFQIPERPSEAEFKDCLKNFQPDVVGISIMSLCWYDSSRIAQLVKEELPSAKVVAGGPHLWVYPGETLSRDEYDIIVIGEGELTFEELLKRLEHGEDLEGLEGIWYKSAGRIISNPLRPVERELDRFPFPDRSDIDISHHRISADHLAPAAVILTSRGCPYQCTFCQNKDRVYRTRNVDLVVEEIIQCKNMGYKSVDFYDDNFSLYRKHAEALCQKMIDRKVNMPWACRSKVDQVDRNLISLMAAAGCKRIHFGVESANQKTLDQIKKGITVEQCREAFSLAKDGGIQTLGYFILGFPDEILEEAINTISFAFELDPDYVIFLPLMPIPGTKLYEEAMKVPTFGGDYVRDFALNPTPDFFLRTCRTPMTEEQILALVRKAHMKFYFRPKYIMRSISRVSGAEDFLTKAWRALNLLLTR